MPPLDEYQAKRDFSHTPEPSGERPENRPAWARGGLAYLIHEHHARALHFDLRLEWGGVLMSWAVPKGPSLDPKDKRLAVHVEDHPLEYGSFEGDIPAGDYGAGTVVQWDHGTWEPLQDPTVTLAKGELKFVLHGMKLQGAWMLVRMKPRPGEKREMWLLFKERDEFALPGSDVLAELPGSVIASPAEIRDGAGGSRSPSLASGLLARVTPDTLPDLGALPGAIAAPMPDTVRPMLAALSKETPGGVGWLHEIKLDGYRVVTRIEHGRATVSSRNGLDWTDRFAPIARACELLPVREAVLDGEAVVLAPDGTSSFSALQDALSSGTSDRIVYFLFDLLFLDGYDLRSAPLSDRTAVLRTLLQAAPADGPLRYQDHVVGDGDAFRKRACDFDLEGVVSKRADSRYAEGRSSAWVKSKCLLRQEFVVGGFTKGRGTRTGPGALLVGYRDESGALRFAGRVGSGFSESTLETLATALGTIATPAPPFSDPPRGPGARDVTWVRPLLVAEVAFAEWTKDGILRQPVFKGLREDKDPGDVVLEAPVAPAMAADVPASAPVAAAVDAAPAHRPRKVAPAFVAGVRLTHPERELFAESTVTKLEVAQYYEAVAERMLPHVTGRPLTLMRCPHGMLEQCFYQRHILEGLPEHVRAVPIAGMTEAEGFLAVDGLSGILELLQLGTLEFHTWGARIDEPDRPDTLVFDLDPGPGVTFSEVMDAARLVRMRVESLDLAAFVKTTGGRGLHVVVPLVPDETWKRAEEFARALAEDVARVSPTRYTTNMRKDRREGAIFIDYVRNTKSSSSVAPYSTRARPGGPVALPVSWDALVDGLEPSKIGVAEARASLGSADPWADLAARRQSVSASARRSIGLSG